MKRIFILGLLFWSITVLLPTPVSATGELKYHQLNVGGKNRSYLVYKPESCANTECPVLFMFHGLEGTAQQATDQNTYNWQATADKNNFLVVFPESLTLPGKSVWGIEYDQPGKHWDIGRIDLSTSQRCSTQDVSLVKQLIDSGLNDAGYQPLKSHIFSTGHSYGAFFSFYVSTCLPDKITAFASHSGGMVSYFWYTFPIKANSVSSASTPGIVLSSTGDSIVSHQWSINLVNELKAKKQINQFIVLDQNLNHNWDKNYNQTQWDFFIANSDPLPEPEPIPAYWQPQFLTSLNKNVGIIFKHISDPNWNLVYDDGTGAPETSDKFLYGPYSGYQPIDVEVSWQKPNYFWWILWKTDNGNSGLWRRASNEDSSLDKYVVFPNKNWELKDMSVNTASKPFVLWQDEMGQAKVERYSMDGKLEKTFTVAPPDDSGWNATRIVMDKQNQIKILWINNNKYLISQTVLKNLQTIQTTIQLIPDGYSFVDFETGWSTTDLASRLMFVNGDQIKITRLNIDGTVASELNFTTPQPNLKWHSFETTSDNRLQVMLTNDNGLSQVWKINTSNGIVESKKEYSLN